MLEGFDSFYKDVNYDEITKTHNMQFCALDEGPFNFKMLCQRVDKKLADNKSTLTQYWMLLKLMYKTAVYKVDNVVPSHIKNRKIKSDNTQHDIA